MSRKKVTNQTDTQGYDFFAEPKAVQYVRSKLIKHREGESMLHTVRLTGSKKVSFWGSKLIDELIEEVKRGAIIEIAYKGKVPTESGRSYHDFEVYELDGDDIPKGGFQRDLPGTDGQPDYGPPPITDEDIPF